MSEHSTISTSTTACIPCTTSQQKCDRRLPFCSICQRVRRDCSYEDGPLLGRNNDCQSRPPALSDENPYIGFSSSTRSSAQPTTRGLFFTPPFQRIDPFLHHSLAKPAVTIALCTTAAEVLGTSNEIHTIVTAYFDTNWKRLPIVSKTCLYDRIPHFYTRPDAGFIVLCLCIHLIMQTPVANIQSMQSSLYVFVKSNITLLESTGFLCLELVQARLLTSYYELGHSMNLAATISIGASARTARTLGLHKKQFQRPVEDDAEKLKLEEQKRVWWGVVILDRYINLCNGDALFAAEDPKLEDHLPIDDELWAADSIPASSTLTLATSPDARIGTFARECQVSHHVGRVLRHVFDPVSDIEFYTEEVMQLERTLTAFLPILIEEQTLYGLYCAAFGMNCSALFILYDAALLRFQGDKIKTDRILNALNATSTRIVQFSALLFGDLNKVDFPTLSPLIPYCLYQAGVIQFRLWKETTDISRRHGYDSLIYVLGLFNRRWLLGGRYIEMLEELSIN